MRTGLLAMTALALVTGCSRGGSTNNVAAGNSTTNAAAPANSAAPAAPGNNLAEAADAGDGESGGAVDVAFLTGRWGVNGDCAQTMEFRADGTVTPPDGSTYAIAGNVVTVNSPGQPPDPKTVTRTGDDAMTVSGGGMSINMTRCR